MFGSKSWRLKGAYKMSQIAKLFDGTSKPDIETLTGDVGGAVSPDAAFNINILSGDFLTVTGTPLTHTLTITLDKSQFGSGQTIGAVTADIITLALGAVATTRIVEAKIVGFNAITPAGCAYNLICGVRTTGAAGTIINVQDKYNAEEAATAGCDANFVVVGNNLIVRVTGQVGLTIDWKVEAHWMEI